MAPFINIGGYQKINNGLKSGPSPLTRMPVYDPDDANFASRGQVVITTTGSAGLNHKKVSSSNNSDINPNAIFSDDAIVESFHVAPHKDILAAAGITYNSGEFTPGTGPVGPHSAQLVCVLTASAYLNRVEFKVVSEGRPEIVHLETATDINPAVEITFGATGITAADQLKIRTASLSNDSLHASGAIYIRHRKNFPNTLTSADDIFHTLYFSGSNSALPAPTSQISGTLVPIKLDAADTNGGISGSDLANALRDAVNDNIGGLTASVFTHLGQATTKIKGDNKNKFFHPVVGSTLKDCTTFTAEETASINVVIDGNWARQSSIVSPSSPPTAGSTVALDINQPQVGPQLYKAFRLQFGNAGEADDYMENPTADNVNILIDVINVYQIADLGGYSFNNEYNVEFNDSLLSLQGYTNARFEGTKLKAFAINQFVDKKANPLVNLGTFPVSGFDTGSNFRGWGGDITYGKNPLITSKINAIFLGKSLTDGEEDTNLVQIDGHSYATIDKILLINTETDEIQIISSENTGEIAFKKFISDNFSEGSTCNFKLFESQEGFSNLSQKLKTSHTVKFNEGMLMRLYTYTPDTAGTEDGVVGGFGLKHHSDITTESPRAGFANNLGRSNDGTSARPGGGLFSFGTTAIASASLFTTNSIDFVSVLPEELSPYSNDINLTIAGEMISDVSSSYIDLPGGGLGGGLAPSLTQK